MRAWESADREWSGQSGAASFYILQPVQLSVDALFPLQVGECHRIRRKNNPVGKLKGAMLSFAVVTL